jgi:hypothetical protein
MLLNQKNGDIEGQARNGDARLSAEVPLSLARARLLAARLLGDHRVLCRVHRARRCACRARDLMNSRSLFVRNAFLKFSEILFISRMVKQSRRFAAAARSSKHPRVA